MEKPLLTWNDGAVSTTHDRKRVIARVARSPHNTRRLRATAVMVVLSAAALIAAGFRSAPPGPSQAANHSPERRLSSTENRLTTLDRQLSAAAVAGDFVLVSQLIADDCVFVGATGKVLDKKGLLDMFSSGQFKLISETLDIENVSVHGDIAVIWGRVTSNAVAENKPISRRAYFTDVWRKNGDWQQVFSRVVPITGAP